MGININVIKKDEKLLCYHFRKEEFDENLVYGGKINDVFRSKVVGNIVSEERQAGSGFLYDNTKLQIQTHDIIKDLKVGDLVKIVQFNKYYIVGDIQEVVEEQNLEYMPYGMVNKSLVLELRGKGKGK